MDSLEQSVQQFGEAAGIKANLTALQQGGAVVFEVGEDKTLYLEKSSNGEILISLKLTKTISKPQKILGILMPQNMPFQLSGGITKNSNPVLVARIAKIDYQTLEHITSTLLEIAARVED